MTYEWTNDDASSFVDFCCALGIDDHTIPLKVWANESNNDPTAHNPAGNASGIFQLMPSTAKGIGYQTDLDPTLATFRQMTVAQQLTWALKFYTPMKHCLTTVAGCYCATFLPAQAAHGDDHNFVVCASDGPFAWAYKDNPSFDTAKKGSITMADLTAAAERAYGPRAQAIAALVEGHADTDPSIQANETD